MARTAFTSRKRKTSSSLPRLTSRTLGLALASKKKPRPNHNLPLTPETPNFLDASWLPVTENKIKNVNSKNYFWISYKTLNNFQPYNRMTSMPYRKNGLFVHRNAILGWLEQAPPLGYLKHPYGGENLNEKIRKKWWHILFTYNH